jgi:hypothetical protein
MSWAKAGMAEFIKKTKHMAMDDNIFFIRVRTPSTHPVSICVGIYVAKKMQIAAVSIASRRAAQMHTRNLCRQQRQIQKVHVKPN